MRCCQCNWSDVVWQLGNPGPAGIGGVLRDSKGAIICMFSQFVRYYCSNTAKILAIKRVIKLCSSNSNLINQKIVIVSDSKSAVAGINKGDFGNVKLVNVILDIRSLMQSLKAKVIHDSRAFNAFVDNVAKQGSNMVGCMVDGLCVALVWFVLVPSWLSGASFRLLFRLDGR
ncbi:hypothetical protein QYF36_022783 [Acer negundo]|nr:hypothetical protein QYF36_022783 [Acer negundo]